MSPICQTFVQNAWRKDLCSNCFKSEEDHGISRKVSGFSSDCHINDINVRRYVSVTERPGMFRNNSRNYYGTNSWNPLMIDNSNKEARLLKSPGLIKGMDSIIKQENEKNRSINAFTNDDKSSTKLTNVLSTTNIPKDSWILSQIIGEQKGFKSVERSERNHGDSSSDLGSDASHETLSSGNTSGCSDGDLKVDSDASSIKSENDSAHEEESHIHGILKTSHSLSLDRSVKNSISFNDVCDVIGYGGDVDYSDDDDYDDDDDDDNSSISSSELNPDERYIKRITEKNTDFNSENENLQKDHSTENFINDLYRYKFDPKCLENEGQNENLKNSSEKLDDLMNKHEVKVKLKRSHPIAGLKPHIKSNSFSSSTNTSFYSHSDLSCKESIPMQGIKPKFVSREEEMQENSAFEDMYLNNKVTSVDEISPKITSIDYITSQITSVDNISPKITSIDSISKITSANSNSSKITSVDNLSPRITSVDNLSPKITSVDNLSPRITSVDNLSPKITSVNKISPKITSFNEASSKITSVDTLLPKITSLINPYSKRGSVDNILTNINFSNDNLHKSSSVDSILKNIPLANNVATSKNTRINNSYSDSLNVDSNANNIKKISEEVSNDISPIVKYVDDMSTYECGSNKEICEERLRKEVESLPQEVKAEKAVSENIDSSKVLKSDENSHEINSKDKDIDYTVRSAQIKLEDRTDDKITSVEDNPSTRLVGVSKDVSDKTNSSKEILENFSSAVIPMNMITIQRRSSFMESQLGGSEFSIEVPLKKSPSSATSSSYGQNNSVIKDKNLGIFKEKTWSQNKNSVQENKIGRVGNSPLKSIKTPSPISKTKNTGLFSTDQRVNKNLSDFKTENVQLKNIKLLSQENSISYDKVSNVQSNLTQEKGIASNIENESLKKESENISTKISSPLNNNNNNNNNKNNTEITSSLKTSLIPLNCNNSDGNSSTNSLSTFGTPVTPTKAPNSSFLHSGAVRPLTEAKEINSIIYSTPEFLKGIKSKADQPPTASIQKASLHASSSSTSSSGIKSIPLGKPATTPKPNFLRDKPKVPVKPFMSSSNIYNREISLLKSSQTDSLISNDGDVNKNNDVFTSESTSKISSSDISNSWKHDAIESCEINSSSHDKEIVYDLPVTVSPSNTTTTFSSPSPSSSSSGYSTTSNISNSDDVNVNIYQENLRSEQAIHPEVVQDKDDSYYRAKFEATRNILSESLSFETKPISNDSSNECDVPKVPDAEPQNPEVKAGKEEVLSEEQISKNETENAETTSTSTFQSQHEAHNYVNITPAYETHDVDSYSSFTDDFDDDDDEEEEQSKANGNHYAPPQNQENYPSSLRRTERSSSATPLFRNSVGPVNYSTTNAALVTSSENVGYALGSKAPAVRSQSVPRSSGIVIDPSVFSSSRTESSSSKFAFVKSGFFRPSSPPSMKRKSSSERGRDRTKKSHSVFSLKKLLRLGSGEKVFKLKDSSKEQEKNFQRETRKMKLQIIHPLDYNTTGVEVISRPEKRSPTYDFTGINDPLIQEALRQHALEQNKKAKTDPPADNPSSISSSSFAQTTKERSSFSKTKSGSERKVAKKNSFLRKKRKSERNDADKNEIYTATSSYVRSNENSANSLNEKRNLGGSNEGSTSSNQHSGNLGFNSEGRPRPPPPPRKTSLDSNGDLLKASIHLQKYNSDSVGSSSTGFKADCDTSSISSTCSSTRPSRPPPPRRAPSNSGSSRHKDSLYANLGNARASFTPRKPGRTASVRDEEREKRKAPNPPPPPSQQQLIAGIQGIQNSSDTNRQTKGPAPPTPGFPHDYEYISSSPEKEEKEKAEIVRSSSSLNQEKTTRQRGRRGSIVTNLSLEDQYGAVVFANLEALSNLLDQMCSYNAYEGYERVIEQVSNSSMITLRSSDPISCGLRLFYPAAAADCVVTVMITPEAKIDIDPLLMPKPLVTLKDDIPSSFLPKGRPSDHASTSGSLWILPQMTLSSLEEFSHTSQRLLKDRASEWERRTCLFLLQVVSALKQLQAKGIEEACLDTILVITNMYDDDNPRILMVSPESNNSNTTKETSGSCVSLCHCAAAAAQLLLGNSRPLETAMEGPILCPPFAPNPHSFSALVSTLREERSSSLTKAKCLLETMIFGPEDMKMNSFQGGEVAIQKWLDLERANVLHALVREQANGSFNKNCVLTKFQLLFLVRTNAKALKDAVKALEGPDVTNF